MSEVYLATYKTTRPGWQGLVNRVIRLVTKNHTRVCIGNPLESSVWCVGISAIAETVYGDTMQLDASNWDVALMPDVTPSQVIAYLDKYKGQMTNDAHMLNILSQRG